MQTLTMPACEQALNTISPRSRTCTASMRSSMSSGSGSHGPPGLFRQRWSTRPFSKEVNARDLAAQVEMPVEQEPGIAAVDHLGAALLEVDGARNVGDRHHRAALEPHRAVVE